MSNGRTFSDDQPLIDGLPIAVIRTDAEWRVTSCNAAMTALLGIGRAEELRGLVLDDLCADTGGRSDARRQLADGDPVRGHEFRLRRGDGSAVWVGEYTDAVHDADGGLEGYHTALVELTARRRALSEVLAANEQFRRAFTHAPIGMFIVGADGHPQMANPAICSMLGTTEEALLEGSMATHLSEDDRADVRRRVELMRAGALDGYEVERSMQRTDGDQLWAAVTVSAVRNDTGQLTSMVVQVVDITERRESEAALLQSQSENRALLDAIPDMMFRVDADGVVEWWRPARDFPPATRPENFLGKHISEIHPEMADVWVDVLGRVMANRSNEIIEYEMDVDGELRSYEAQVAAIDGSSVLVAIRDVTERARLRRRLEGLIQSKDEFVASVSHALRTPLTSILGFATELRDRWSALHADEVRGMIDLIADQGRDMSELIEDLLVAARGDVGMVSVRSETVGLGDEIRGVLAALPHAEVEVEIVERDGPVAAVADAFRLRQIMRNLLVNGLRHGARRMEVHIGRSVGNAVVLVRNAGPVIPEGEWDLVFDPYEPAAPAPGAAGDPPSVGLGLSVARMLAWLMEGDLTFFVEDGQGTFELLLPERRRTG